jgi:hypothetical protein
LRPGAKTLQEACRPRSGSSAVLPDNAMIG